MLLIYGWLTFGVAIVTLVVLREKPPTPPSIETLQKHSFAKGVRHILNQQSTESASPPPSFSASSS